MQRAPFDTSKPFHARQGFTFAGYPIARGDEFPWSAVGCDERRLRQLYDQRMVECGALPASLQPRDAVDAPVEAAGDEAATAPNASRRAKRREV